MTSPVPLDDAVTCADRGRLKRFRKRRLGWDDYRWRLENLLMGFDEARLIGTVLHRLAEIYETL